MSSVQCLLAILKINGTYRKINKQENYSNTMQCIHLTVSGKVQGVFFRDSTRKKAQELGLNGYAKNLPDGNGEVVAEGPEEKINELISFIKNNPGHSKVKEIKINRRELENFLGFGIK